MEWILAPLKKYAVFSGRARRKEFWLFYLAVLVACVILAIPSGGDPTSPLYALPSLLLLATLVPYIAVAVRRLHDQGKTGKLAFLLLIPGVGGIILLILCIPEGTQGANQYGPDPKAVQAG